MHKLVRSILHIRSAWHKLGNKRWKIYFPFIHQTSAAGWSRGGVLFSFCLLSSAQRLSASLAVGREGDYPSELPCRMIPLSVDVDNPDCITWRIDERPRMTDVEGGV
jgi:hypothetical protein